MSRQTTKDKNFIDENKQQNDLKNGTSTSKGKSYKSKTTEPKEVRVDTTAIVKHVEKILNANKIANVSADRKTTEEVKNDNATIVKNIDKILNANKTINDPDENKIEIKPLFDDKVIDYDDESNFENAFAENEVPEITTINLTRCMYSIVKEVAEIMNMVVIADRYDWDIYWSDFSNASSISRYMKLHQRINHIPGLANLGFKCALGSHLNGMMQHFPVDYMFYPKTWILPDQIEQFKDFHKMNGFGTYLIKPNDGAEGKNIKLFKKVEEIDTITTEARVCQVYINSLLIDGYKFDLRVYVLITCVDPLRIFVYNDGLIRMATCKYQSPNEDNINNQYMHLTNYSINKNSINYNHSEVNGSKRNFKSFNKWLDHHHVNASKRLWFDIDDIIIKTIISVYGIIKQKNETLFYKHHQENISPCFELLGFDILIDNNLKPYLLEINRSPSFAINCPIDNLVKRNMILDTFKILCLNKNRRNKRTEQFRTKDTPETSKYFDYSDAATNTILKVDQMKWESINNGNYRLIFPKNNVNTYNKFIQHVSRYRTVSRASRRSSKQNT